eukprot:CAMPEP_0194715692 /NCGR_PEP_ID=MMETSP0296-20130528/7462_1 /TAXON_ID=39354 /ORGANISM="Heterosigma akashiwo, Strain CCMP2393" /LENGTH=240 /DNA_ID=CAMNT_0039615703 /DNA_START=39 /DNA_END=757 /DNA_ORIENTATION=-
MNFSSGSTNDCSVSDEEVIQTPQCKWIGIKRIKYIDHAGKNNVSEAAFRLTKAPTTEVDAVEVVAIIKQKDCEDSFILVSQFRPPVGKQVLEFPAGLVDGGERPEVAALREMREETGYHGEVKYVSPVLAADPGMSNATFVLVGMEIDGNDPRNQKPAAKLEEGEFVETHTVPVHKLLSFIYERQTQANWMPDGKLLAYALGLFGEAEAEAAALGAAAGDDEGAVPAVVTAGQQGAAACR